MTKIDEHQASIIDLINNLSRAFIREFNFRLTKHNVTYAQWRFLLSLWQQNGLTQKALSQHAGIEPATTVRTLDRMERDGLITRQRSVSDRREINIHLTEQGKALQPILEPIYQELEQQVINGIDTHNIEQLKQLLISFNEQVQVR